MPLIRKVVFRVAMTGEEVFITAILVMGKGLFVLVTLSCVNEIGLKADFLGSGFLSSR